MKTFFYILAILGSLVGSLFLFMALTVAESAPQEASLAAIAVAFAAIPYCFARAIDGISQSSVADNISIIADYYRRREQAATSQRIQETRQQTGADSPFAARPKQSTQNQWPE